MLSYQYILISLLTLAILPGLFAHIHSGFEIGHERRTTALTARDICEFEHQKRFADACPHAHADTNYNNDVLHSLQRRTKTMAALQSQGYHFYSCDSCGDRGNYRYARACRKCKSRKLSKLGDPQPNREDWD